MRRGHICLILTLKTMLYWNGKKGRWVTSKEFITFLRQEILLSHLYESEMKTAKEGTLLPHGIQNPASKAVHIGEIVLGQKGGYIGHELVY